MIRKFFISCLILCCIIAAGCVGDSVIKSSVVQNAENYSNDGLQAFSEGDWKRAKNLFRRALSLYQGIDNQQGVLYSHINLLEVALAGSDYPSTQKHLRRAIEIAKMAGFKHYQSRITLLSAQSELQQQHYVQAEKLLQLLLPEFNGVTPVRTSDMIELSAIANRVKIAFVTQQDETIWTQRYANALLLSKNNSPALENRLLRFQSNLLHRQQQYHSAESYLQRALSGYKKMGFRKGIAATLAELGQLSITQRHWQNAQSYFIRSNDVFRFIGDVDNVIHNTKYLVEVESELGNIERSNILREWLIERKIK